MNYFDLVAPLYEAGFVVLLCSLCLNHYFLRHRLVDWQLPQLFFESLFLAEEPAVVLPVVMFCEITHLIPLFVDLATVLQLLFYVLVPK